MTGDFYECPKCGWRARLSDVDIRTRCSCGRMVQLPAATAPNPRAWAVARELAAESGLDWGLAATGRTRECAQGFCLPDEFCGDFSTSDIDDGWLAFFAPLPAPWDADAYRADAARRGVEPGPMPSLHGRTVNGLDWCVFDNAIEFRSGTVKWFMRGDELQVTHTVVPITREQWVEIGILATAAKRAMGT